jgi:tetratricopeptide (TPR) repeat protein
MSPEQAAGRHDQLRPPSDVYSLGAILYNILTGRVAIHESSLSTLLRKVQAGDFPPPRRVKPSIPRPLEAICLKAMAKQPEDRYPDARALASDLEHWLADEPVSVYREPLTVQLARWAKRHKTWVASAAALLLTATAALAVGTVLIRREQQRTEVNFHRARDAVDQMLTQLGEVELADVPQMEPVRRKMLDKALAFYLQFLKERGQDRWLRQETGRASTRLGDIQTMLGDDEAAEKSYLRAISLLEPLAAHDPRAAEPSHDLAMAQHGLGLLLKNSNRYDESERALRTALQLRQSLTREFPGRDDFHRDDQDTLYHLGALLARMPGRIEEVDKAYQEAVEAEQTLSAAHPDEPDYRRKLAQYLNNRANLLKTRKPHEAESIYREAVAILQKLAEQSPSISANQWRLARSLSNLGATFEAEKRPEEAVAPYRDALARLQRLSDDFPSVPDYLHELAAVQNNLGLVLMGLKQPAEADTLLTDAATIYTKLAERFPARPAYRQKLAITQRKHGILLANNKQQPAAEAAFRDAQATLRQLVAKYPTVPEYQADLGTALDNLAFLLLTERREAEARKCVEEAIEHQKVALASNPKSVVSRDYILMDYAYLERLLPLVGAGAEDASQAAADVLRTLPDEPRAHRSAARLLATAALLARQDPGTSQDRRAQLAQSYAQQAVEQLRKAADGKVNLLKELKDPVYNPIRDREDFQRLQKTVEGQSQSAVG